MQVLSIIVCYIAIFTIYIIYAKLRCYMRAIQEEHNRNNDLIIGPNDEIHLDHIAT